MVYGYHGSNAEAFHQPRLLRESYGELVQIDGSEHRWFEDRSEQRHVSEQLSPCHMTESRSFLNAVTCRKGWRGQYVEVYDFAGTNMDVRWKGHSLPYRVLTKDQRVSHTAIVGNKRLGHALSIIKASSISETLRKL